MNIKSEFKYVINKNYIDINGHFMEAGYYYYAVQSVWDFNLHHGIMDVIKKTNIGPITFKSGMTFYKEVFEGEEILVKPRLYKNEDDDRYWSLKIKIINKDNKLSAEYKSLGSFMDLKKRKITSVPIELSFVDDIWKEIFRADDSAKK